MRSRRRHRRRRNPEAAIDRETGKHLRMSLDHMHKALISLMRVKLPGAGVIVLQKLLSTIVGKMEKFIVALEGR